MADGDAQPIPEPDEPVAAEPAPKPEPEPPAPAPDPEPEPVVEPAPVEPQPEPDPLETPITFEADEVRYGTARITRATAISQAEAIASQQSSIIYSGPSGVGASRIGGASDPLATDQLQSVRRDAMDQWDSRWQFYT